MLGGGRAAAIRDAVMGADGSCGRPIFAAASMLRLRIAVASFRWPKPDILRYDHRHRAGAAYLCRDPGRPEAANAFNTRMAEELTGVFEALNLDPGDTRVVVLTGAGEKAFCAGGDLKERHGMSDEAWFAQHRLKSAWCVR